METVLLHGGSKHLLSFAVRQYGAPAHLLVSPVICKSYACQHIHEALDM